MARRVAVLEAAVAVPEAGMSPPYSSPSSLSGTSSLDFLRFLDSARIEEHNSARHARLAAEDVGLELD